MSALRRHYRTSPAAIGGPVADGSRWNRTATQLDVTHGAAPDGNPRYCDACLPVVADRLRQTGTPIAVRYRYPEAVFGADDANVGAVKRAAGFDEAGRPARPAAGETGRSRRAA